MEHQEDMLKAVAYTLLFGTITKLTMVGMLCVTAIICADKIAGAI